MTSLKQIETTSILRTPGPGRRRPKVFMVLGCLQDPFSRDTLKSARSLSLPLRGQLFPYTPYPLPPLLISMFWRLRCVHLSPVSIKELEALPTGLTSEHPGPGRGQLSSTVQRTRGLLGYVVWGRLKMAQGLLGVVVLGPRKRALQAVLGGVVSSWAGPKVPLRPGSLPREGMEAFSRSSLGCQMKGDLS